MSYASELMKKKLNSGRHVRIKLLGDSITHGVGGTGFAQDGDEIILGVRRNPGGYCWANQFQVMMESKYDCTVVNNAMSGSTINYISDHFNMLVEDEDDLIICTVGTNNRHQYHADGPKRSREEHAEMVYGYILQLHDLLKNSGKDFIFVTNLPAAAFNEVDCADFWRILHMDDIDGLYKKAQAEFGFAFISMYDLVNDYCKAENILVDALLCDGLHPNDEGFDVMFRLTCQALELEC